MSTVAFDTYKAIKALRSAGFNDSQAEAVTEQIGAAISEGLATTGDIQSSRSELKGDIQALEGKIQSLRSELKGDIQALEGKIQSLRSELKGDIQALEGKIQALEGKILVLDGKIQGLEGKIQTIESRLTVKLYSALVLAVALIKALDYFWPS